MQIHLVPSATVVILVDIARMTLAANTIAIPAVEIPRNQLSASFVIVASQPVNNSPVIRGEHSRLFEIGSPGLWRRIATDTAIASDLQLLGLRHFPLWCRLRTVFVSH
jgi:hypothetical protein